MSKPARVDTVRRLPTLGLALLVAALAAGVWNLWSFVPDTRPIQVAVTPAAAPMPAVDDGASLTAEPRALGEYANTTRRPLFFPDRRPADRTPPKIAEAAVKQATVPPSPLEQFQLLGIEQRRNSPPRALIRTTAGGQGVWFEVGDYVRGWKVAEISDQNAVFLANGLRGELRLFALRGGKPR